MRMRSLSLPPLAAKELISHARSIAMSCVPSGCLTASRFSLSGNDGTRTAIWIQPLDGTARKIDLGDANPCWDVLAGRDRGQGWLDRFRR